MAEGQRPACRRTATPAPRGIRTQAIRIAPARRGRVAPGRARPCRCPYMRRSQQHRSPGIRCTRYARSLGTSDRAASSGCPPRSGTDRRPDRGTADHHMGRARPGRVAPGRASAGRRVACSTGQSPLHGGRCPDGSPRRHQPDIPGSRTRPPSMRRLSAQDSTDRAWPLNRRMGTVTAPPAQAGRGAWPRGDGNRTTNTRPAGADARTYTSRQPRLSPFRSPERAARARQ
jgi:hypothetical protein